MFSEDILSIHADLRQERNLASSDTRAAREENGSRVSCRRSVKKEAAKREQSRKELDRGTRWDDGTLCRESRGEAISRHAKLARSAGVAC